jgi:hypothetical protein
MSEIVIPDEIEIPDGIEPVIAWKALKYENGMLYSPSYELAWPIKQRAEASCGNAHDYGWEPKPSHEANTPEETGYNFTAFHTTTVYTVVPSYYGQASTQPQPRVELPDGLEWSWEAKPHIVAGDNCSCGIYAVDSAEACLPYAKDKCVICTIAMWGHVVPGSLGARAQYAYPQSIEFAMGLNSQELLRLASNYGLTLPKNGKVRHCDPNRRNKYIDTKPVTTHVKPVQAPQVPVNNLSWRANETKLTQAQEPAVIMEATIGQVLKVTSVLFAFGLLLTTVFLADKVTALLAGIAFGLFWLGLLPDLFKKK